MSTDDAISAAKEEAPKQAPAPEARDEHPTPKRGGGSLLAGAALIASTTSLGLHFLPTLADRFEAPAAAKPWIARVEAAMVNRNTRDVLKTNDLARLNASLDAFEALPADARQAFRSAADMEQTLARMDKMQGELTALQQGQARNDAALERAEAAIATVEKKTAAQDSETVALRGSLDARFDNASTRMDQFEARVKGAASRSDLTLAMEPVNAKVDGLKTEVETLRGAQNRFRALELQVAELAEGQTGQDNARILLSRMMSASQSGPVDTRELEMFAQLTADDTQIAREISELKVLSGLGVQPAYVLRDRFHEIQPKAMDVARSESLSIIGAALAAARNMLAGWGFAAARDLTVGELAIMNANEALDSGNLSKALFELEAAPNQARRFLSVWMGQAKLRLSMDRAFSALVDHLAFKQTKIPPKS